MIGAQFKSDFLRTFVERGAYYDCSAPEDLDALFLKERVTAYIGFDCTATSMHIGNLVQLMTLRRLQQAGHRPILLMGGGTTKLGDPSGKDEVRKLLTPEQIDANKKSMVAGIQPSAEIRRRRKRRHHDRQRGVARQARIHPVPAGHRPPLLGQSHADDGERENPTRARAAAVVPRIQLHGLPGL